MCLKDDFKNPVISKKVIWSKFYNILLLKIHYLLKKINKTLAKSLRYFFGFIGFIIMS